MSEVKFVIKIPHKTASQALVVEGGGGTSCAVSAFKPRAGPPASRFQELRFKFSKEVNGDIQLFLPFLVLSRPIAFCEFSFAND